LVIKYFGKSDEPVFTGLVFQQMRLSSIVAIVFENVYRDFCHRLFPAVIAHQNEHRHCWSECL